MLLKKGGTRMLLLDVGREGGGVREYDGANSYSVDQRPNG